MAPDAPESEKWKVGGNGVGSLGPNGYHHLQTFYGGSIDDMVHKWTCTCGEESPVIRTWRELKIQAMEHVMSHHEGVA